MKLFYELEDNQKKIQDELTGQEQFFYGKGKLLLTGEYFVMDGARSLAVPTKVGQSLKVRYSQSFSPKLHWKSYDYNGKLWMEVEYELWHFDIISDNPTPEALWLQKVLQKARGLNSHFLRDQFDMHVETHLGFPLEWGLGSSSTLIYNVAQWAYVSPFALLFDTIGGSGYDIACAQSEGPIIYSKDLTGPHWQPTVFDPVFSKNLYFVYLGQKQDSREGINHYQNGKPYNDDIGKRLSSITDHMLQTKELLEFESLMKEHELLISNTLNLQPVQELRFADYWGQIKSLGAWGGDFILATSNRGAKETTEYFKSKGLEVILPYRKLIDTPAENSINSTDNAEKFHDNKFIH